MTGVLREPTLTVSPWFEARRAQYYDHLLAVSTRGDWDAYVRFFAQGLEAAASTTRAELVALVDLAVANPTFTVRKVEAELNLSYVRGNKVVGQLVGLGILQVIDPNVYKRRFFAPRAIHVLSGGRSR